MARPKKYFRKLSFNPADRKEKIEPPCVPSLREILGCKNLSSFTKLALEGVVADCYHLECSYEVFAANGFETPHFRIVMILAHTKYESTKRYASRLKREALVIWPQLNPTQFKGLVELLDNLSEEQMKMIRQYVLAYKRLLKVVRFDHQH